MRTRLDAGLAQIAGDSRTGEESTKNRRATRAAVTLLDQAISSATNFAVAIVALRALGSDEFGAYALAMGFYAVALGVCRGVVSEPLAVEFSDRPDQDARRGALGTSIAIGALFAAIGLVLALLLGGPIGTSLAVLSVFLPLLLAQDSYRLLFIMDRTPWKAVINDAVWGMATFAAMLVLLASSGISLQSAIGVWATAGSVAALLAVAQARIMPRWDVSQYVKRTWHLGGRFAAEFLVNRGSYEIALALAASAAGLSVIGDIAGARTVFGPVNVILLGFLAFGIPEASRLYRSHREALKPFVATSGIALAALGPVTAVLLSLTGLGPAIAGDAWGRVADLIVPVAGAVAALGAITALTVGLRARSAASESLRASMGTGLLLILLTPVGALVGGAMGAAIGLLAANAVGVGLFLWAFVRSGPQSDSSNRPAAVRAVRAPRDTGTQPRRADGRGVFDSARSLVGTRLDGTFGVAVGAFAIAAGAAAVASYTEWSVVAAALVLAGIALVAAWHRLAAGPLSLVKIVVLALMAAAIVGPIAYRRTFETGRLPTYLEVGPEAAATGAEAIALLAATVAVGAAIAVAMRRNGRATLIASSGKSERSRPRVNQLAVVLMVPVVPLLLLVLGSGGGPTELVTRTQYIATTAISGYERASSPALFGLGLQIATIGVAALGYAFAKPKHRYVRAASLVSAFAVFALFVALGSRRLALVPVLFAAGAFAASAGSVRARRYLAVAAATSVAIVGVAWFLRGQATHGLLPYLQAIASANPAEVLELTAIQDNVAMLFAQVSATVVVDPAVPESSFWVSVNPLPGFASGWYDIAPALRLNAWTPFPAVGQLASHGWPWLVAYGLAVGAALGFVESGLKSRSPITHQWAYIVAAALAAMFTLFTLQYNLRSATRVVWYVLGAYAIYLAYLHVRGRRAEAGAVSQRSAASVHQRDHVGV